MYLYSKSINLSLSKTCMAWIFKFAKVKKFYSGLYKWKNKISFSVAATNHSETIAISIIFVSGGSCMICLG